MATYYVTGVWKLSGVITNVMLHSVDANNILQLGRKTTEFSAIALIEAGNTVSTLRWNYGTTSWNIGARIGVVTENGRKYLRTRADTTVSDNLDNMILMSSFIS